MERKRRKERRARTTCWNAALASEICNGVLSRLVRKVRHEQELKFASLGRLSVSRLIVEVRVAPGIGSRHTPCTGLRTVAIPEMHADDRLSSHRVSATLCQYLLPDDDQPAQDACSPATMLVARFSATISACVGLEPSLAKNSGIRSRILAATPGAAAASALRMASAS